MAITPDGIRISVKPTDNEDALKKKPRTRIKDRPFSPPELGLRPSRYGLADKLYAHYARIRNDRAYADQWEDYLLAEKAKNITKLQGFAVKREAGKGSPSPVRVRASELKNCARSTAMRLMGFQGENVGEDSPHWALAALIGTEMHEELEIALKFLGLLRRSEFNARTKDGTFAGRVDGEVSGEACGEGLPDATMDIKTVGTDEFKKGTWSDKTQAYVGQVSAYARIGGKTIGIVLLADRGSGRLMDYEWDIDPEYGDKMLRRANVIVEKYVKVNKLPKAEAKERGNLLECRMFCPFARLCARQEEDGSIQFALDAGKSPKEF